MTCLDRSVERVDSDIPDTPEERDIMRVVRVLLRQRLSKCMCIECHNGCWKEGRKKRARLLFSMFRWRRSRLKVLAASSDIRSGSDSSATEMIRRDNQRLFLAKLPSYTLIHVLRDFQRVQLTFGQVFAIRRKL